MDKIKFDFSSEKNYQLITERGVSFEDIIVALSDDELLDVIEPPNQNKYPNQCIYIINLNNYIYMVPFVKRDEMTIFLKTIIPSRKLNRKYLGDNHEIETE